MSKIKRDAGECTLRRQPGKKPVDQSERRMILVVEYDVTGLSEDQIDVLALEAVVQGEASDTCEPGHPDVAVTTRIERRA